MLKLADGIYDLRLVAVSGSTIRSIAIAYVLVDTAPRPPIITGPQFLLYAIGSQEQLNWYLTNPNPGNYTVYKNNSIISQGNWSNYIPVSISLINLSKGLYNFTILAFDTTGLNATNTVFVKSYHRAVILGFGNVTMIEGDTGQFVRWNVTDDALANYTIYQNDTNVKFASISGTFANISYNLTGLTANMYNFTLGVYDQDNVLVTNTLFVTVLPSNQTLTTSSTSTTSSSSQSSTIPFLSSTVQLFGKSFTYQTLAEIVAILLGFLIVLRFMRRKKKKS